MSAPISQKSPPDESDKLKIYFLPNLLTAGNLFCGFLALTKIVEADPAADNFIHVIHTALFLILLACILICSTDALRAWAETKARSGVNSIRSRILFHSARLRR